MSAPLNSGKLLQLPPNIVFSFDKNPSQGNLMDWEIEQFTLIKSSYGFLKPAQIQLVIELSREVSNLENHLNNLNRGGQFPQYLKLLGVQFSDLYGALWLQVNLIYDKKSKPAMNVKQISDAMLNIMGKFTNRATLQAKDIWVDTDAVAMDSGKFSPLSHHSTIYVRGRLGWRED